MYVHIFSYLSASSSIKISRSLRVNDGVLCRWSNSLPGVAMITSGDLRRAASCPFKSKPPEETKNHIAEFPKQA